MYANNYNTWMLKKIILDAPSISVILHTETLPFVEILSNERQIPPMQLCYTVKRTAFMFTTIFIIPI